VISQITPKNNLNYSKNILVKAAFILGAFSLLFICAANASVTTDYSWSSNKFLSEINKARSEEKLTKLVINKDLSKLAQMRLNDMTKNDYFAHESPSGNDIDSILKRQKYKYLERGENLAYGEFVDEKDVMVGWMNSKWHKYNIEYAEFNNIGIAHKVVSDYMGGDYILVVTIFTKEKSASKVISTDSTKLTRPSHSLLKSIYSTSSV
jgi:uncharacterized protein YkwD